MAMKVFSPAAGRLRRFQEQFAHALVGPELNDPSAGVAQLVAQPGFAVYRNTVRKGCIDALQANYPAVTRLVGEEWMRAAAAEFARTHLPASPMLLDYGAQFASFLAEFAPAADLPYLPNVARLDRLWTEAHCARDETPIEPGQVTALAPDELARVTLRPHASARWQWFEQQPIFTIWSRNRDRGDDVEGSIEWRGEGALLVRPCDNVQAIALSRAEVAFLDACAAGQGLVDAAQAALAEEAAADLAQLMARLLSAGAFGRIDIDRS
jgi:hypothetical protein